MDMKIQSSTEAVIVSGVKSTVSNNTAPKSKFSIFKNSFDAVVTWILGLAFLIAGFPHWANSYYFLGSVYAYKLVDPGIGQIAAMSMPIIQLVIALCLLTRVFLDASHLATMLCLIGFATIQTTAYVRDLGISCGCFGPGYDEPIGWFSLSLVYGLLTLSVIRNAIFLFSQNPKQAPCPTSPKTDALPE